MARDGEEALDYLLGRGAFRHRLGAPLPRLVLLDFRLPRVDGVEVLRALRASPRASAAPVVMLLSASDARESGAVLPGRRQQLRAEAGGFAGFYQTIQLVGRYWLGENLVGADRGAAPSNAAGAPHAPLTLPAEQARPTFPIRSPARPATTGSSVRFDFPASPRSLVVDDHRASARRCRSPPLEAQAAPAPIDIPFERFVLPNGLTLIVHEDHKAPIVAVNVWYHVGSKNEKPGRTGFAHLFEHLMFNGSENFNDDYFKPLEQVGATDLNGTTNEDRTNYFQNVPTNALDLVLWLESDRMGHLLGAIDQAKLDEQRGVVQNEKRQGENQPYGRVVRAPHAAALSAEPPLLLDARSARWRTSTPRRSRT